MTKYRLFGLLLLIVFVGLVVYSLQSAKDVSVQEPISSQMPSQDESILIETSSIIEPSSSATESVHDEPLEVSEDYESSSTNHEFELHSSKKSLSASNEDTLTSQNDSKQSELSSSKKDDSTTKSRKINYLGQMFGYLKKNLDKNDYGFLWWEDNTIFIYVVNEQAVKEVVNNYNDSPVEVEYIPTKYSFAQMDDIIEELENVDFIKQGIERDEVLIMHQRFKPGILIEWLYEVPQELVDFMKTYQYRDCVEYQVAILCPLT